MFVYGSVIWAHSINRETLIEKLRSFNRLGLSTYTLFPKSTPTRAVELLTDTFPLHLWLEKEAMCAYIRLAKLLPLTWSGRNANKRHNTAHRRYWADKIEVYELDELLLELDYCAELAPVKLFQVHKESFHTDISFLSTLQTATWEVYTDGSKIRNKVGAAIVIYKDKVLVQEIRTRLPNTASVFQAELFAIYQASVFFQDQLDKGIIHFFSDSMSALQAIVQTEVDSSLVLRTIQQLNKTQIRGFSIHLFWVKAHMGITGNELADKNAKKATELSNVTYVPLPRAQVRAQVIKKLREMWKSQWQEYDQARHSKLFLLESDRARGKQVMTLNRVDLRRLIMAITNHNNLRYHQNLHDNTINPTCRFCRMYDETFDHFFTCPYFQAARYQENIIWPITLEAPWEVDRLISFINNTDIKRVLDRRDLIPIRTSETASEDNEELSSDDEIAMELDGEDT